VNYTTRTASCPGSNRPFHEGYIAFSAIREVTLSLTDLFEAKEFSQHEAQHSSSDAEHGTRRDQVIKN
jgi:hypothetical protein